MSEEAVELGFLEDINTEEEKDFRMSRVGGKPVCFFNYFFLINNFLCK